MSYPDMTNLAHIHLCARRGEGAEKQKSFYMSKSPMNPPAKPESQGRRLLFLRDGPPNARRTVLFAHGAGAGMDSPFMAAAAQGLAARGLRVLRFEFPYMVGRRAHRQSRHDIICAQSAQGGKKRPPDRMPVLLDAFRAAALDTYRAAAREANARSLILAGKSMGGRAASLIADEIDAAGLVCFGFPFHPPGKSKDPARVAHLARLRTPALIVQGERDPFGGRAETATMTLSPAIGLHWVADGDHDLKPRKSSGLDAADLFQQALDAAAAFIDGLP